MVVRKAKLSEQPNCESRSWLTVLSTSKRAMMSIAAIFMLIYILIGQLISWIQYISDFLVFTVMPIKIAFHVFSSDSDLRKHMENLMTETNDMRELKIAYKQSRKIKRNRSDYAGTLLRQILVVTIIRIIIMMIPILTIVPVFGMFSHFIHIFFIFLIVLVQIPTAVLNYLMSLTANKLNIKAHSFYMDRPLSDRIITQIKICISDSKLSSIRTIRDILLKYDERTKFCAGDGEQLMDSLNNLGISKEYLKSIGLDFNNMNNSLSLIKEKIDILFVNILQFVFDGNINKLMINAMKNTSENTVKTLTDGTIDKVSNIVNSPRFSDETIVSKNNTKEDKMFAAVSVEITKNITNQIPKSERKKINNRKFHVDDE